MNCKNCGFQLNENDRFCMKCGTPVDNVSVQNNNGGFGNQVAQDNMQLPKQQNVPEQPMSGYNQGVMPEQNVSEQPMNSYNQGVMPEQNVSEQPMNSYNQGVMPEQSVPEQPMNSYNQGVMPEQNVPEQPTSIYSQNASQETNWKSGYNSSPVTPSTKNSNVKFIIIGIVVAIIIFGIFVIIGVLGGNKSNNSGTNTGGTSVVNNNSKKSNYTVKFGGFTFKIPTNLVYETKDDSILLGDEEGTWATYIEIIEGSYSQMLSKKGQLQSAYQSMGFTSSVAVEKTIGGMSFITLEISKGGTNALVGLVKANSMNIFGVTAYNANNEFDYNLLETVSSILSNAEFGDTTNNISVFEKPNINGIAELAK